MAVENEQKKTTLIFTFSIVVILAFIGVIFFLKQTLTSVEAHYDDVIDHEVTIAGMVAEIDNVMLQCRRNEKDFLLRHDMKYPKKLAANISALLKTADELGSLFEKIDDSQGVGQARSIIEAVKAYQASFQAIVTSYETKGLDHKSGLQGSFRNAAHQLMDGAKAADDAELMVEALMLRRHEKDYLLRKDDKYVKRVLEQIHITQQVLEQRLTDPALKETLSLSLEAYGRDFNALVAEDK
ncbi:MAG: hypothetical protein J7L69_07275, partial [Desulfobulbaceae bacterium]|nr:hypothetical protein [Desulfobulbaceae bacterium]